MRKFFVCFLLLFAYTAAQDETTSPTTDGRTDPATVVPSTVPSSDTPGTNPATTTAAPQSQPPTSPPAMSGTTSTEADDTPTSATGADESDGNKVKRDAVTLVAGSCSESTPSSFKLSGFTDNSTIAILKASDTTTPNFTYTFLTASTNYEYTETSESETFEANEVYTIYYDENNLENNITCGTTPSVPVVTLAETSSLGEISASWNGNVGISSFNISATSSTPSAVNKPVETVTSKSHSITGLTPGATYVVAVTVANTYGSQTGENNIALKPAPVTGLTVEPQGSGKLLVSWANPTGVFSSVQVQLKDGTTLVNSANITDTSTTSKLFSGLSDGKSYTTEVTVKNGEQSSGVERLDGTTQPGPVTELSVSPQTRGKLLVSWKNPTGDFASVEVQLKDGTTLVNSTTINDTSTTSTVFSGLSDGKSYTAEVTVKNGAQSSGVERLDGTTQPGPITGLKVEAEGQRQLKVSWTNPTGSFTSVQVQLKDGTELVNSTTITDTSTTSTVFSGLSDGTSYTTEVTVKNGAQSSEVKSATGTTADTPRINLDGSSITITGQTTSTIAFKLENLDFPKIDYYAVYVKPKSSSGTTDGEIKCTDGSTEPCVTLWKDGTGVDGNTEFEVGSGATSIPPTEGTTEGTTAAGKYTNLPLKSGNLYKIAVKARSDGNSSDWATLNWTSTFTKPPRPTNVGLAQDSSNPTTSLSVSWSIPADSNADGYNIEITPESGTTTTTEVTNATATSVTVGGLKPGFMYKASVTSYVMVDSTQTNSDPSAFSNIIRTNPLPPTMLGVSQSCSSDVTVTFTPPNTGDFDSYKLQYSSSTPGILEKEVGKDVASTSLSLSGNTQYTFVASTISNNNITSGGSGTTTPWTASPTTSTTVTKAFTTFPDVATNVNAVRDGPKAIQVTFTTGNAAKYSATAVGFEADNSTELTRTGTNTASPIQVTGLTPGGKFTCSVTSYNSENTACTSSETKDIVIPPSPVTGVTVTDQGTDYLNISWTNPTDSIFDNHNITVSPENMVVFSLDSINGAKSTTTASITGLTGGTTYNISVSTVSFGVSSTASPTLPAVTGPNVATGLTLENIDQETRRLQLSWTEPAGNYESLFIEWNGGSAIVNKTEDKTSYVLDNLTQGSQYTAYIITSIGGRNSTRTSSTIASTYPAAVTGLKLEQDGTDPETKLTASWTKPEGKSDGFIVQLNDEESITINTTSHDFPSLTQGEQYNVTVLAMSNSLSSTIEQQTGYTKPAGVGNLNMSQNPDDPEKSLQVTWDPPQGRFDNITFEVTMNDDMINTTTITDNSTTTQEYTDLTPGQKYQVFVITNSYMEQSSTKNATEITNPARVNKPTFEEQETSGELIVKWNLAEDVDTNNYKYRVSYQRKLDDGKDGVVLKNESETTDDTKQLTIKVDPYSNYTVKVNSFVEFDGCERKNGTESEEVSLLTIAGEPGDPPSDKVPSSSSESAATTETIKFTLPEGTFTDKYGPIEAYAVYLRANDDDSGNEKPNTAQQKVCTTDHTSPCITLWTDETGSPLKESKRRKKRSYDKPVPNKELSFTVGDGEQSFFDGKTFHNYKLAPDSKYQVAVAAKTPGDSDLVSTDWSEAISTKPIVEPTPPPNNTGLIVGIVFAVIIAALVFFLGWWFCWRKRRSHGKSGEEVVDLVPLKQKKNSPMDLDEFRQKFPHVDTIGDVIEGEYEEFKSVGREQATNAAQHALNRGKNRYTNILPYDHSRVKLNEIEGEQGSDYINANYIPGHEDTPREYIAAQGPLTGTKEHFWRMVWEQNSRDIVMVTQCVERGKAKCDHYWPYDDEPVEEGEFTLTMHDEAISPEWTIRQIKLERGDESREIRQFHYTVWPDHGVPDPSETLVRFIRYVRSCIDRDSKYFGPTVVHCSAGVGRTGTFIALDRLLQHLKEYNYVDIYGIVYQMRQHRMFMVQTESQYILLHQVVYDLLNNVYDEVTAEENIYENTPQEENVYENTFPTTFRAGDTNGGVVNPALISPTDDEESSSEDEEDDEDDDEQQTVTV